MYIREAHAEDSSWPMPIPGDEKVYTPKTYDDRVAIASKCRSKLEIDMPCLVDDMDNTVAKAFGAWPDRLFIVDEDGKIAVRAGRGPWGFKPAVGRTAKWLAERFPDG